MSGFNSLFFFLLVLGRKSILKLHYRIGPLGSASPRAIATALTLLLPTSSVGHCFSASP